MTTRKTVQEDWPRRTTDHNQCSQRRPQQRHL